MKHPIQKPDCNKKLSVMIFIFIILFVATSTHGGELRPFPERKPPVQQAPQIFENTAATPVLHPAPAKPQSLNKEFSDNDFKNEIKDLSTRALGALKNNFKELASDALDNDDIFSTRHFIRLIEIIIDEEKNRETES